ncbi:MAG: hypothetical protein JXR73_18875 [Candidatus Omnitrophica bacterium]|nr:hypothetical protein [Candidatus Omnitrophota bacterium]
MCKKIGSLILLWFLIAFHQTAFPQIISTWAPEIAAIQDFELFSIEDNSREDLLRTTKFLSPAGDNPDLLDTVYQNVNIHLLHLEFMAIEFPEYFAGLTAQEYMDMVLIPETRMYYAGAIYQFQDRDGNILYGFNIYASPDAPPQPEEIQSLYQKLSQSMKLRPFAYSPMTPANIEIAKRWQNPGFPIYLPTGLVEPEYEVYSPATNYGRIRCLTLAELENAVSLGQIGWQDIVVLDAAPTDIETVVAGIVTGTRQGELSHINVRSLRRGTPNAYIQSPVQVFEPYEGELIKLSLFRDGYEITHPVDLSEAEAWWAEYRPNISPLPDPDDFFDELVSLEDMDELEFFDSLITRFGGKASQLGILYSVMGRRIFGEDGDIPYLVDGFAIPFCYYQEFMQSNLIPHPDDFSVLVSYEEYIHVLMEDSRFRSDTAFRQDRLKYFMDYMEDNGTVNQDFVAEILAKIIEVYGSTDVKVRFRSSSNAEDDIAFSGAGLYDSTSVCALDNLDADDDGPSHCDPSKNKERTVERGLKKVWSSLWKPKAFEERDYYQIDHQKTRMGILVSRAYPAEDCNGVAFTGDPVTGSKNYYIINVQKGDESVVQPGTGIIPEKDIISFEAGFFPEFRRARQSSLMPEGEWVLSDEQLDEIAMHLMEIEQLMPVDSGEFNRDQIFFDIEFKYQDGQFVIKQIRPTLMASAVQPPAPLEEVILHITDDAVLAANFNMQRTLREEYEVHSMAFFKTGDYSLPLESGDYELDLIERFEFGPERLTATPAGPGIMRVEVLDPPINDVILRYEYFQKFLINGKNFDLTIQGFELMDENQRRYEIVFDSELIINQLSASGVFEGGAFEDIIPYKTPNDEKAQFYRHDWQMENGQHIILYEAIRRRLMGMGFVFAYLVCADVKLSEGSVFENDYWNLIYTAQGHCWNAKSWVLFDEPIGDAYGAAVLTTTLQWGAITEAEIYLLDKNLEHLRKLEISSYSKEEIDELPDPTTGVSSWLMH